MPKLYTVSQLAKCFNLSRSTLLYYDRKKILTPSVRDSQHYRFYNEENYQTLKKICTLREVGISLNKIAEILKNKETSYSFILNQRLLDINDDIHRLRNHQRLIVELLGNKRLFHSTRSMNKEKWVQLLRSAGLDEKGMLKWHQEFEKNAPVAHQDFLESLGLDTAEIKKIRRNSQSS